MLRIDGVSKVYRGGTWGVRELTLEAKPGVLGLLGPNGAGKTTLMRILATVTRPTAGRILLDGVGRRARARAVRRRSATCRRTSASTRTSPRSSSSTTSRASRACAAARARIDELLELVNLHAVRAPAARRLLGRHAAAGGDRAGAARRSRPADRGRAHRRARSGGARALPQPALRALGRAHRHPLDAHRLRRRGDRRRDRASSARAACWPPARRRSCCARRGPVWEVVLPSRRVRARAPGAHGVRTSCGGPTACTCGSSPTSGRCPEPRRSSRTSRTPTSTSCRAAAAAAA